MSTTALDRLRTARMIYERLCPNHLDELLTLLLDPRVGRTLWTRLRPPTEIEVAENLAAKVDHWERYGFGMWLLRDRFSGEMVGRGGLQYTHVAGADEVEAGWAIVPARWGQGLATELALECVEVALGELSLGEIIAFTLPENIASRRVMEKAGFTYCEDIEYVGLAHVLYRRAAPSSPVGTLNASAPLTRSSEARKEHVASRHGRTRPG